MNQTSNAIGKQHVDFPWLDQRRNFAGTPNWVTHRLAGAIRSGAIVWFTVDGLGSTLRQFSSVGKRAASAALRAGNSRD